MESGVAYEVSQNGVNPNHIQSTGMIWMKPISPADDDSWAIMPEILRRIERFCEQYDSLAKGQILKQNAMAAFVTGQGFFMCAFIRGNRVVGHAMADMTDFYGTHAVTILQFMADEHLPKEAVDAGLEAIQAWAWQIDPDLKEFLAVVSEQKLVQHFKQWGFKTTSVLMRLQTG